MNEGCNGGWPLLNGFFAESTGIPLEGCAPYKASNGKSKCSDYKECDNVVQVEKTYYVGGFYGNASEATMMKELRCRGPIIADLEVP
jgi:hypothetical protein